MQVFLSHASEDKGAVAKVAIEILRANSQVTVWVDNSSHANFGVLRPRLIYYRNAGRVRDIDVAEEWRTAIMTALSRSGCVLAFWSWNALSGKRAVFRDELSAGIRGDKLVQVRLDDCLAGITDPYNRLQIADLSPGDSSRYHSEVQRVVERVIGKCGGQAKAIAGTGAVSTQRDSRLRHLDDDRFVSRLLDRRSFDRACQASLSGWIEGKSQTPHFLFVSASCHDRPEWLSSRAQHWIWSTIMERREFWRPIEVDWIETEATEARASAVEHFDAWRRDASLVKLDVGESSASGGVSWPCAFFCTLSAARWSGHDTKRLCHIAETWENHPGAPPAALVVVAAMTRDSGSRTSTDERVGLQRFAAAADEVAKVTGADRVSRINLEPIGRRDALDLVSIVRNAGRRDIGIERLLAEVHRRFPETRTFTMAQASERVVQALAAARG